jgi:hypothetical protein
MRARRWRSGPPGARAGAYETEIRGHTLAQRQEDAGLPGGLKADGMHVEPVGPADREMLEEEATVGVGEGPPALVGGGVGDQHAGVGDRRATRPDNRTLHSGGSGALCRGALQSTLAKQTSARVVKKRSVTRRGPGDRWLDGALRPRPSFHW